MSWQALILLSVVTISVASLLQRFILKTKDINPVSFAITFQVLVGLFFAVVLLFKGFSFPDIARFWPFLILTIVLWGSANALKFRALKKVEISEFAVLYQISVLTTVLIAIFLLGEKFFLQQFIGLILVIAAVILVSWKNTKLKMTKYEIIAIISAIFYGAAFINDAYILRSYDAFSYTFYAFLGPGLATWLVFRKDVNPFSLFDRKIVKTVLLSTFLYSIAVVSVYLAYQAGRNAAQISALGNTQTILIVILAAIFLKERDKIPRKLFAAALSVAGVILLG